MRWFNKKRLAISGMLAVLVVLLLGLISLDIFSYSRYETVVTSQNTISTALYLVNDQYDTINVKLPEVVPDNHQYHYSFSVSNYNGDQHCDTNIKYHIHIRTTTNVDITYQVFNSLDYENSPSAIASQAVIRDRDGTHFKHIYTTDKIMLYSQNKTDYYTILFTFPDDYLSADYSSIVELIEINVESNQILESDT